MKTKSIFFICIFTMSLLFHATIFAQPAITLLGATLNDGFIIDNSDTIIFAFERTMASTNTEISIALPTTACTYHIYKDGAECPVDGITDCTGSLIIPSTDPGSILIINSGEAPGTSLFEVKIEAAFPVVSSDWQVNPIANADIQFARAIPDIDITAPAEALSGETLILLNATSTASVYEPASLFPAPAIVSYSWTQTTGPVVPSFTGSLTATPTFDAPTVTVDTDLTFQLTVTDDIDAIPNSGDELTAVESVIVTVLARQDPVDALLLLDTSGSMGWYHDGSVHDLAGGCCSRLAGAKAAARYFLNRLETFAGDSRVGVAIFPAEPAPGTNYGDRYSPAANLADTTGFSAVETDIGEENPPTCGSCNTPPGSPGTPTGITVNWNGTPTQYGLDAARTMLTTAPGAASRSQVIVLLSDGAWNVGTNPTDASVINPLTAADIHVYTIGMGTGADNVNHTSLQDISVATGIGTAGDPFGFFVYNLGVTSEDALFGFFEKIMAHMITLDFANDPPGIIAPGKTNTHKTLITSHDSIVSFTVSWKSSVKDLLDLSVITPNGERIESQVSGNGFKNVTVGRKYTYNFSNIGEWIIEVTNRSKREKIYYNYSVMTKSKLNMKILLDKEKYTTGDTMLIEARLIEDNVRLKGATVKAKIKRPETGIGNWHFEHKVSQNQIEKVPDVISGETLTLVDKKNYVLLHEQQVKLPETVTEPEIIFNDEGLDGDKYPDDGIYTGRFDGFAVPGLYKFQISANGTTYNEQQFTRQNEVQKYVDMNADSEATKVKADFQLIPGKKTGMMTIEVTPFDKAGNYLGPGYADMIHVRSSEGEPAGGLEDRLDGTYTQPFLVNDFEDPQITISVRGQQVFNGPYSELAEDTGTTLSHTWELSLHAGYPVLHRTPEITLDPGISGILDAGYQFTNFFSIELLLGCHYFFEDENGDNFYWLNASLNGKLGIPLGSVRIYVNGGAGIYMPPDPLDSCFGWNAGGGLAFAMTRTSYLELGYNYHNVMSSLNNEFSVIQLGLRFGF